jgi:intracellular sulfur oxidation DsrE/DsrF family protein
LGLAICSKYPKADFDLKIAVQFFLVYFSSQILQMKRSLVFVALLIVICASSSHQVFAQGATRAELMEKQQGRMIYPFIKGSIMTGVLPVPDVSFPVDANKAYKLLFDFASGNMTLYKEGKVNPGLEEICRILNLHSAAGVADRNLDIVVVLHGPALMTFANKDEYQKRFQQVNANMSLIEALQKKGVRFVVCGQSLQLREMKRSQLMPGILESFSARTALSTLIQQGYVLFPIEEGN